jgi:hypothetical protein
MRRRRASKAERRPDPLGVARLAEDHEIERLERLAANRVEIDFPDDLPDVAELERAGRDTHAAW